ncbi:MAG: hypothetical protein RR227_00465 [Oscillospiraceae bacterium]
MRKNAANIILGLLLIAGGIYYGGSVLGFWELSLSLDGWWTIFIVLPCLHSLITTGFRVFNCTGLIIGVMLFLSAQEIIPGDVGYKLLLPIIVVAVGLNIIFHRHIKIPREFKNGVYSGNKGADYYAVFGGNEPQFSGINFTGANTYSVFGGIDLKLQNSIINQNCVINAYAIFGGTDIILPPNVKAIVNCTPVFGGVENRFVSAQNENAPIVLINATCIFGGMDIK